MFLFFLSLIIVASVLYDSMVKEYTVKEGFKGFALAAVGALFILAVGLWDLIAWVFGGIPS